MGLKPWKRAELKERVANGDRKARKELKEAMRKENNDARRRYHRRIEERRKKTATTTCQGLERPQLNNTTLHATGGLIGDEDDAGAEQCATISDDDEEDEIATNVAAHKSEDTNDVHSRPKTPIKSESIDLAEDDDVGNVFVRGATIVDLSDSSEAEIELMLEKVALEEKEVDLKLALLRMQKGR